MQLLITGSIVLLKSSIGFTGTKQDLIAVASKSIAIDSENDVVMKPMPENIPWLTAVQFLHHDVATGEIRVKTELEQTLSDMDDATDEELLEFEINALVNDYQKRVVGSADQAEQDYYEVNAEVAANLLSSVSVNAKLLADFEASFAVTLLKSPEKFAGFDIQTFAKWIHIQEIATKAGIINIRTHARQMLMTLLDTPAALRESKKEELKAEAENIFNTAKLKTAATMYLSNAIDAESQQKLQDVANSQSITIDQLAQAYAS